MLGGQSGRIESGHVLQCGHCALAQMKTLRESTERWMSMDVPVNVEAGKSWGTSNQLVLFVCPLLRVRPGGAYYIGPRAIDGSLSASSFPAHHPRRCDPVLIKY